MSETTNENIQEAEVVSMKPSEAELQPREVVIEELKAPELIGTRVISIDIKDYEGGKQEISVRWPDNASLAENLGMLKVAAHLLLKDKF